MACELAQCDERHPDKPVANESSLQASAIPMVCADQGTASRESEQT
jgi:hypothetical protein